MQQPSQQPFAGRATKLPFKRETPRKLCDAVVEQRHAALDARSSFTKMSRKPSLRVVAKKAQEADGQAGLPAYRFGPPGRPGWLTKASIISMRERREPVAPVSIAAGRGSLSRNEIQFTF